MTRYRGGAFRLPTSPDAVARTLFAGAAGSVGVRPPQVRLRHTGTVVWTVLSLSVLVGLYGLAWMFATLVIPDLGANGVYPTSERTEHRVSPADAVTFSALVLILAWFIYRRTQTNLRLRVNSWTPPIRGVVFDVLEVVWFLVTVGSAHWFELVAVGRESVHTLDVVLVCGVAVAWLLALIAAVLAVQDAFEHD